MEVADLRLRDRDGNGLLSPGEVALLRFRLNNLGGITAYGVRTVLSADDSALQIDRPDTRFGAVEVRPRAQLLQGEQFPQVSMQAIPEGKGQVNMTLEVFSGEAQLARREFKLQFAPLFKWSGRVRDAMGEGVEGTKIRISGMSQHSVTTGKDGAFQIDLIPGAYYASVSSNLPGSFFEQGYHFDLTADLHFEWVLTTTYPVSGTIRDPQGQPLQADISASMYRHSGAYHFGYASSAKDGAYTLMLTKGTYTFSVGSTSPEVANRTLSNVYVDGPQTLDIALEQGVRFSAQLIGEQGDRPVGSLYMRRLSGYSDNIPRDVLQTDSEGKGTLRGIQPGAYLAEFFRPYLVPTPYSRIFGSCITN